MKKKAKPLIGKNGEVRPLRQGDSPHLVPLRDHFPELAADSKNRKVGRPRVANPKRIQSFKLSSDLIDSIKNSGPGFNVRVEAALRAAVERGFI